MSEPAMRVLAKQVRHAPSAEYATWHAAEDLVMNADGTYLVRVWSWFHNSWAWRTIREPEVVLDGREEKP